MKSNLGVYLFLLHFRDNTLLHAVSCLLGCLPDLSNDNNPPITTCLRCYVMIVLTY